MDTDITHFRSLHACSSVKLQMLLQNENANVNAETSDIVSETKKKL